MIDERLGLQAAIEQKYPYGAWRVWRDESDTWSPWWPCREVVETEKSRQRQIVSLGQIIVQAEALRGEDAIDEFRHGWDLVGPTYGGQDA